MSNFFKSRTDSMADVTCPYCGALYDITWDTEYGDPLGGGETTECEECEKEFDFFAVTRYEVYKKE